jgi:hypothetical protein
MAPRFHFAMAHVGRRRLNCAAMPDKALSMGVGSDRRWVSDRYPGHIAPAQ